MQTDTFDIKRARASEKETNRYLSILHQYWGYSSFKGIQADIIKSVAEGHDTLGVMPTGGGKSVAFQVPSLAMEGVCIVVTPLIALMKDQVDHLRRRGIQAAALHIGQPRREMTRLLDNCILGTTKFLYVSPERLQSALFLEKVSRMRVCLIVVDEAHCISQWGHDFRPAYLHIADIRKKLSYAPVLALTATATPEVAADIERHLRHPDVAGNTKDFSFRRFTMSCARHNLRYIVRVTEDVTTETDHILRSVAGSAIVYTRSRQGTQEMAAQLVAMGHNVVYYHAGLTPLDKEIRQRMWVEEDVRVMVATNAFGMGIDKPNVRLVIHADLPDCIEAYFQEAGRAGRDGQTAYAVCLCQHRDQLRMMKRLADKYPDANFIREVYEKLGAFFQLAVGDGLDVTYEFNINKFCRAFHAYPSRVVGALDILTQAGYINFREEDVAHSRVLFIIRRDELYQLQSLSELAEKIIQTILRTTSGVFSEYATIYEKDIAEQIQSTPEQVYDTLKALNNQHILQYVPRKHVPFITFTRRRVETRHLILTPEVLDDRREGAKRRAEAMLQYTLDNTQCHSQYLLSYFGETNSEPCGHCDVCLHEKRGKKPEHLMAEIIKILRSEPLPPERLRLAGYDEATHRTAIEQLIREERIELNSGKFILKD